MTIQSYRHRFGYAAGDPALDEIEAQLAAQPKIAVPTIALQGEADGVQPPETSAKHARPFHRALSAPRAAGRRPQPAAGSAASFADAVLELIRGRSLISRTRSLTSAANAAMVNGRIEYAFTLRSLD